MPRNPSQSEYSMSVLIVLRLVLVVNAFIVLLEKISTFSGSGPPLPVVRFTVGSVPLGAVCTAEKIVLTSKK